VFNSFLKFLILFIPNKVKVIVNLDKKEVDNIIEIFSKYVPTNST
jgi:hypothetical protein